MYLDKEELKKELVSFRKTDVISENLGKMLMLMVDVIAKQPNFRGYSYIDEMKSEAILNLMIKIDKIDPDLNVFAYINTMIIRSFQAYLNKERKYCDLKENVREKLWGKMDD